MVILQSYITYSFQGLPNHQRMAFWGGMPVYWNADRSNYAPAPPILRREEL